MIVTLFNRFQSRRVTRKMNLQALHQLDSILNGHALILLAITVRVLFWHSGTSTLVCCSPQSIRSYPSSSLPDSTAELLNLFFDARFNFFADDFEVSFVLPFELDGICCLCVSRWQSPAQLPRWL